MVSAAYAQVPRVTLIATGAGVSCAEWLATGRADDLLEQWAFGFASAIAAGVQLQAGRDPLASLDADAIHAWLPDYCRVRPGDALSVALTRMVLAAASRWYGCWPAARSDRRTCSSAMPRR